MPLTHKPRASIALLASGFLVNPFFRISFSILGLIAANTSSSALHCSHFEIKIPWASILLIAASHSWTFEYIAIRTKSSFTNSIISWSVE
ncbi:MAG: hypothetical protein ACD_2C00219G0002 [uncultured bacterium (gcode 4)]|uniref:Uncharacterized protein n=1 Tax=uncultured bacterium (gcode 4) TaxID=1234023 RepID=K2H086_9BACT|nr:MAG: hypothetical protein ACD_2C00219G0002 [uncultured bacterium (gcode 4)]